MRVYTVSGIISIILVLILDEVFRTRLRTNPTFWRFQLIIAGLTTLVDSFSSGRPIVIFNESAILNLRFFHVPLENYLFGFSLITLNLILFEYFSRRSDARR